MRLDVIKGKPALRAGLAIFASLMFSEDFGDANADISKDVFDAISIEQLSVEPATQGASARVKFAIVEAVLLDVREPISHGDTVHLTLHFRSFSIPVVAHAHP